MIRRSLAVVGVVLLLITAGCLGVASAQSEENGTEGETTTVTVHATGEATGSPDRAIVHVSVVAVADAADDARRLAAEDAEGLRSALVAAGIDEDAVSTVGYHLGTDYRREDPDGYRVTHRFAVELSDVESAGRVIDAAVAGGASRIEGVTFTLSDETRRDLRSDAIATAMTDARTDAESIAGAESLSVVGLESASTSSGGNYVPYYREAADAAGQTTVDPGPVSVSVGVTVTYAVS